VFPTPYITEEEVVNWTLPVTWSRIGPANNPTPQQNVGQIEQMCEIATSIVDGELNQMARATVDVETVDGPGHRVGVVNSTGLARCLTSMTPVLKVVGVRIAVGPPQQTVSGQPYNFQWITVPSGLFYPQQQPFRLYGSSGPGGSSAGQNAIMVAGGYISWVWGRLNTHIELTYVNGWPHTSLTAEALSGATTLQVDDVTGWYNSTLAAGALGQISDLPNTENATVTAVTAAGSVDGEPAGPGTLTLAAPLTYTHQAGTVFTAMPKALRDATALFVAAQAVRAGLATISAPALPGAAGGAGAGGVEGMVAFLEHSATIQLGTYRRIFGT
jgi:hypothetical protein